MLGWEAAIARLQASVNATPEDHPDRARWLSSLGAGFSDEQNGNVEHLEAAIAMSTAGVEATPEGHPDRATWLNRLGSHLSRRYKRTRNLQDLEGAITQAEAAVEATPEDHPDRAGRLNNLETCLSSRYERTGNLQDLEATIARSEAAVEATPEDHPDRAGYLNNLGINLSSRYERTGNLQDLEAAIARSEAVVEATPEDHPDRAGYLNNLGIDLSSRYERTGNLQDLEAAIARSEVAVEATPEDHPDRAGRLSNLGSHFSRRYERTGNLQDLEAAIARSEAAVEATPADHPGRAVILNYLGSHLTRRYKRTGNLQDSEAAVAAFIASWSITSAPILTRIQAASNAASLLVFRPLAEDLSRACSLLRNAIQLMPLATSRSLGREDQQHILGQLTGLASLAASVSLEVQESPLEALQLLELGRSITNGQLLDYRSDISNLMEAHPTLATDFDSLRLELDSPFPSLVSPAVSMNQRLKAQQSAINRRNQVAQDLDNILSRIRQQLGFENFLRAESELYLLSAAKGGTIVVLNVTRLRSDAILVTESRINSIPLPHLSHSSMLDYCGISTGNNEGKRELLEWLWKGAASPVLRKLGFYPTEVDPLPHIWWIGVGLMAKAPIHSAAKFKKSKVQRTTLQYCLSSYTSTLRALQYSRSRQCRPNTSMLLVTMPTTPGQSSLRGVIEEANGIKQTLDLVDMIEWPSAACVLKVLPSYSIVHFACHGVSTINPADSHLLLVKDSGLCSEKIDKLRVRDIVALKLPAARLAYLSACSTAESISSELVDEVTHIVSSFHIAGFMHVIGTLWPSEDEACEKMAVAFYAALSKTDDVAVSYRTAILGLMKEKPMQPLYWAPFVHFGA